LLQLDITDCYGSIYTHSIAWSLHDKKEAKKIENRNNFNLIGNKIDKFIRNMSNGQTNGIPQGSVLMDFIAEIVLGYGDLLLSERLENLGIDYKILRYRDDYRIYTNSQNDSTKIAKELSVILSFLNFKLNSSKTISTDDLILGSLKKDKIFWLNNKQRSDNIQKRLLQIYSLGQLHPNSGSLYKEVKDFLKWIQKKQLNQFEKKNIDVLISIVVNLAYNNPRVYSLVIAIISILLSYINENKKLETIIQSIKLKFDQQPNTEYLNIWLQRLTLNINPNYNFSGKLCNKVIDDNASLWNSDWLNKKFKNLVDNCKFIDRELIEKLETKFSKEEITKIGNIFEYNLKIDKEYFEDGLPF
jgi:hypothetical protein